jgi:DNA-directed RNA polymerase specialized sigma24 family protein
VSLEIIAKYHKEWIAIVRSFGGGQLSDDIVQDFYLKYNDNYIQNNQPNRAYIWITLRNIFLSEMKHREAPQIEEETQINEENFDCIIKKANFVMDKWHWYDKKLFEVYVNEGLSMREIASRTGISLRSIFSTLDFCKRRLRAELEMDFKDLYEH